MIAMNTLKFRLLKACAVATDFVRGRLKMKKIAKMQTPHKYYSLPSMSPMPIRYCSILTAQ